MVDGFSTFVVCRERFTLVTVFRYLLSSIHLSKLQHSIITGDISPACGIYVLHSTCLCNSHTSTSRLKDWGLDVKGRYIVSILDIVCMAAFISSLFALFMTFPVKMHEFLLQDYFAFSVEAGEDTWYQVIQSVVEML
jgi:hypothetical protein